MLIFDDDLQNIDGDGLDNGDFGMNDQLAHAHLNVFDDDVNTDNFSLNSEDEKEVKEEIQGSSDISFGGLSCDDCSGSCSSVCANTCASACLSSYSS